MCECFIAVCELCVYCVCFIAVCGLCVCMFRRGVGVVWVCFGAVGELLVCLCVSSVWFH